MALCTAFRVRSGDSLRKIDKVETGLKTIGLRNESPISKLTEMNSIRFKENKSDLQ